MSHERKVISLSQVIDRHQCFSIILILKTNFMFEIYSQIRTKPPPPLYTYFTEKVQWLVSYESGIGIVL